MAKHLMSGSEKEVTSPEKDQPKTVGRLVSGLVNVRSLPSVESKIVCKVRPTSRFEIIEVDGGWANIWVEDADALGYIQTKYLELDT